MSLFSQSLFPPAPKHTDVINRDHHPVHDVVAPDHLTAQPVTKAATMIKKQAVRSQTQTYVILGVALAAVLYFKMNR